MFQGIHRQAKKGENHVNNDTGRIYVSRYSWTNKTRGEPRK